MLYRPTMTTGVESRHRPPNAAVPRSLPSAAVPFGHDPRAVAVRRVAGIMIEHLDGLAVRSASEIWHREAEFRDSLTGVDQLYEPCRVTMGAALDSLIRGRLDEQRHSDVRALGRLASEQGIPLEVVLRGLRVDFLVLWSEMLLVARTTDPTTQQSLINASEIVWGAVDTVTVQFTIGYRSNHEARARAEAARRDALLRRVCAGEPVSPTEVSDVLGFGPVDQLVVVAVDHHSPTHTEELARCIRHASMHSAWIERDGLIIGVVALRGQQPDAVVASIDRIHGVRAGMGRPVSGVAEVPAGLGEAQLALAAHPRTARGVASLFDDPAAILVVAQPDLTSHLLQPLLAPLLERPERERELLVDTLVAFDECDGSVPAVADRVFCHRNTVLNRLAKITRLTGISFTTPSGLALAALLARAVRTGVVDLRDPS